MIIPPAAPWILPLAWVIDTLFGEPPSRWHPVCRAGAWAARAEAFWTARLGRTRASGLGAAVTAALPGTVLAAGSAWAAAAWGPGWLAGLCCSLWVALCMAPRSLAEHAARVHAYAERGDLPGARKAVSMIVGRDTEGLDAAGVLRAAVESVSENFTDGVLSTLFWAAAGWLAAGPAGCAGAVALHRQMNMLDALWGKKNDQYRHFGTVAARTDDVLNYLPARLALVLIACAACLLPGMSGRRALAWGWQYRRAHASPNSAWSEAAFAGALDLRLGGPVSYKGVQAPYPWIGDGRLGAEPCDLARAVQLMRATTLLAVVAFVPAFFGG